MKTFNKFKVLISCLLMFLMLLSNVSAYYSSFTLMSNIGSPISTRYPMYRGTNVSLSRGKRTSYEEYYNLFLFRHPLEHITEKNLSAYTTQECYEQEIEYIGACAYATALIMMPPRCEEAEAEALKLAEGTMKLCNGIIGYPNNFKGGLYVYVANYIYGLLGFLFKEGTSYDIKTNTLYKFSTSAHDYSWHYCSIEGTSYVENMTEEIFKLHMAGQ